LLGLPLHETFGNFSNPGVVSGWPDPSPTGSSQFNYSAYVFADWIAADGPSWNPAPVYTSSGKPYIYNTLLKYAPQTWRVGSQTPGNGTQVHSGNIKYYRDHGYSE